MWHLAERLWIKEQGQDITEYSLLLAFVVLASTGIFLANATSIYTVWAVTNGIVNQAAVTSHGS
jgi:hypothetical protein